MQRLRRCKIIATLGPASNDEAAIERLWRAGADLFRINMSHADPAAMRERVAMIRAVEERVGRSIGVLVDLQGPKLRVGAFAEGGAEIAAGDKFTFDSDPAPGDATRVCLPHPEILASLRPGHALLIDDGRLRLHVIETAPQKAVALVDIGGRISNRKGVSLPDTELPVAAMTPQDRVDLDAALETGVDWIALSFVQRGEDVAEVKKIADGRALIMAKIEKPQAIARLDEILAVADGVIVGTSLKIDGDTWSRVDPARAERLMDTARALRSKAA
jgi:pyruvate kinase